MVKKSAFYDVVIIGGGPAGLAAAVYLARADMKVAVLEKINFGGQIYITEKIVNYPGIITESGAGLTENMKKQAESFGAELIMAEASKIQYACEMTENDLSEKGSIKNNDGYSVCYDVGTEICRKIKKICLRNDVELKSGKTKELECYSIIIATGARPRILGFEGEKKFKGRGVSYCATCDGGFFMGKDVYVIGGGYVAAEESIYLTKFAKSVTVIMRKPDFSCPESVAKKAKNNEKIILCTESVVEKIEGEDFVTSITVKNVKTGNLTTYNAPDNDNIGVFVFAGYEPSSELVAGGDGINVEIDSQGYIVTDEKKKTSAEGIFAAGDVCVKSLRQVVTAVSDGAVAAVEAAAYVDKLKG